MSDLSDLLERSRIAVDAMTPEQRGEMIRAQRRSFIRAEAGFGSDADEAAYNAALASDDHQEMARLKAESASRIAVAETWMAGNGL